MSESNSYNFAMLRAIISCSDNKFNDSLKYLDEAERIESFNTHTWTIKALVEIIFYSSLKKNSEKSTSERKKLRNIQLPKKLSNKKAGKTLTIPEKNKKTSQKYKSISYEEQVEESRNSEEMNEEILYSAEELINRCILKEPENDQLLYILSAISYELDQY